MVILLRRRSVLIGTSNDAVPEWFLVAGDTQKKLATRIDGILSDYLFN